MSFATPDELKPGNDTTKAMIAFGTVGGVLTVAAFFTAPGGDYNFRRQPTDPTEAQLMTAATSILGVGLVSFGITSILGGVRRTMPYVKFGQDDAPGSTYSSHLEPGT